jgi:hypothetical protein
MWYKGAEVHYGAGRINIRCVVILKKGTVSSPTTQRSRHWQVRHPRAGRSSKGEETWFPVLGWSEAHASFLVAFVT